MPEKLPIPGLWKVIEADYPAWLGFVIPTAAWVFFLFLWLTKIGGPEIVRMAGPVSLLTAICLTWLAIRYAILRAHFSRAVKVPGKIVRYLHLQDLGRVIYTYVYNGQEYRVTNYIHASTRTLFIDKLTEISVAVDTRNPRSALVWNLYSGKPEDRDEEE